MKKKYFVLFVLFLFFLLTGGGITGSVPLAFAAPTVSSISPQNNACISSQTSQNIVVKFSTVMEPSSVENSVSINNNIILTPSTTDNITFTFTPSTNFVAGTTYTFSISTGATDSTGIPLSQVFSSQFTANTSCVPEVISHSPGDGGTISATGVITATFSTPMSTSTVDTTTFTVTSNGAVVSGAVTMDSTQTVATFKPSSSLALDTTYIAAISRNVQSTAGTSMAADVTWSFTANSSNFQNTGVKCFIATAAYGSYLDPHVKVLRSFRDKYLLTNAPGTMFVKFYYDNSPPMAEFISKHESLRLITRGILTPVVYVIEYPLSIFAFIGGTALILRRRKKRNDHV